jgi:hypothetical protein
MSFMDKIKSWFSGGSSPDAHAGHDHSAGDHSHEPVTPPMPPADPTGMPTSAPPMTDEPELTDAGEDRPA